MTTFENDPPVVDNADDSAGNDSTSTANRKVHPHVAQDAKAPEDDLPDKLSEEHGGQAGLEPTRYGDWEKKGRCTDF